MSVSGRQLHSFRSGWACVCGSFGGLAHHFRRIGLTDEVISSCGLRAPVRAMWGVGTYPTCRKCRKKHGPPVDRRTCVDGTPLEWMVEL